MTSGMISNNIIILGSGFNCLTVSVQAVHFFYCALLKTAGVDNHLVNKAARSLAAPSSFPPRQKNLFIQGVGPSLFYLHVHVHVYLDNVMTRWLRKGGGG